jgi:hypothetical protein
MILRKVDRRHPKGTAKAARKTIGLAGLCMVASRVVADVPTSTTEGTHHTWVDYHRAAERFRSGASQQQVSSLY